MPHEVNESVGEKFNPVLLEKARDKTLAVIEEAKNFVKAGMTEVELKEKLIEIQEAAGYERTWHPPQVRFGPNSTLPFGVPGQKDYELQENDIYFLDLGLVFEGHEGDVGRPYTVGDNPEQKRCCEDAKLIWQEVRDHWSETGVTGSELYEFAEQRAQARDWVLSKKKANGHRISDFPHAARIRGTIMDWEKHPETNRWILEIQINHPSGNWGAFYEDLLV